MLGCMGLVVKSKPYQRFNLFLASPCRYFLHSFTYSHKVAVILNLKSFTNYGCHFLTEEHWGLRTRGDHEEKTGEDWLHQ